MQVINFLEVNCKNCYKCVRTCEVKAIEIQEDRAKIIPERCVACGHCLIVCPQNARDATNGIADVLRAIKENRQVVVSIAPSYRAYFEKSGQMIAALKKIGITQIEETAVGAEVVSKAYETYISQMENKVFITTCCPSTVRLIERYYPELIKYMIPVVSPMIAHGKLIKEQMPNAYTVFIGPCVAKIGEAITGDNNQVIDAALTFDEVISYLESRAIDYTKLLPKAADLTGNLRGTEYPLVGGVLKGIRQTLDEKQIEVLRIHGMANCKEVLELLKEGKLENVCIEMNMCSESCLNGPGAHTIGGSVFTRLQTLQKVVRDIKATTKKNQIIDLKTIDLHREFSNEGVTIFTAEEEEITAILEQMGKYEPKDELNCSSCGYKTCREQAVAVKNGMSQIDMCLPHTRSIAEKLSNEIFYHSPNSIFILDRQCHISDMNPSAEIKFGYDMQLMNGKHMEIIMDTAPFEEALRKKKSITKEKINLENYQMCAYRNIIYLEKQQALLVIFTDITDEEIRKQELKNIKVNTLDVTQSIIDKQMRVAQEIASLLGETTAETKVAIMKLRHVIEEEVD